MKSKIKYHLRNNTFEYKNLTLIIFISFLNILLFLSSCIKDKPLETDPAKIILGKWSVSSYATNFVPNPGDYFHFLPDSILNEGNTGTGNMSTYKYWIDSLLHTKIEVDGKQLIWEYKYEFSDDNNELVIEHTNFYAMYNIFKLKRIR